MSVPHALLQIFSLIYLASVLTFVLALNEQEAWPAIWREARRRWLKLVGVLAAIGAATMVMTMISNSL